MSMLTHYHSMHCTYHITCTTAIKTPAEPTTRLLLFVHRDSMGVAQNSSTVFKLSKQKRVTCHVFKRHVFL